MENGKITMIPILQKQNLQPNTHFVNNSYCIFAKVCLNIAVVMYTYATKNIKITPTFDVSQV